MLKIIKVFEDRLYQQPMLILVHVYIYVMKLILIISLNKLKIIFVLFPDYRELFLELWVQIKAKWLESNYMNAHIASSHPTGKVV